MRVFGGVGSEEVLVVTWEFGFDCIRDSSRFLRALREGLPLSVLLPNDSGVVLSRLRFEAFAAKPILLLCPSEGNADLDGFGVVLGFNVFAACHSSQQLLRKPE